MENNQSNIGYFPQMPVCDGVFGTEINADFTLPDYKSEIRKLLLSKVTLTPPKKYMGNDGATLEGEMRCKLIYVGADSGLYCAPLTDTYKLTIPFEFNSHSLNTDDITFVAFCYDDGITTRVLGPRKVNLRAKVVCRALGLSPAMYAPKIEGIGNPSSLENLVEEMPCAMLSCFESNHLTLSDEIPLDADIDSVRIVDYNTSAMLSECFARAGKLHVRGEVILKLLYCNDAESAQALTLTRKLPFSTEIDAVGIPDGTECSAYVSIEDENIRVDENSINAEVYIKIHSITQHNEAVQYISDAFSTEYEAKTRSEDISILCGVKNCFGNLTQNDSIPSSELKIDTNAKIIDCHCDVKIDSFKCENGKVVLVGKTDNSIIYYHDGEYSSKLVSMPLKYELDIPFKDAECSYLSLSYAECVSCRARHDGERIFIDRELQFCILLQERKSICVLDGIEFCEKLSRVDSDITLCYPGNDATLWSVSKRYYKSPELIRKKNSLSDDNISKKKYIII